MHNYFMVDILDTSILTFKLNSGHCSTMRRYPWQPCEWPPPGTITLKQFSGILIDPLLTWPIPEEGGREGWQKPSTKQQQTAS